MGCDEYRQEGVAVHGEVDRMAAGFGVLQRYSIKASLIGEEGRSGGSGLHESSSLFGEEGLLDGGLGLDRCSLKDAVVSEEGAMKGSLTQRKVAEQAAGCLKGGKSADAVTGDVVEEAPTEGKRLTKLPLDEVLCILAQKPWPIIRPDDDETLLQFYPPEEVGRIRETKLRAAEVMASVQERFFAFQEQVRKEFKLHGVVKVDDEFLARREQTCQWMREEFEEVFDRMETLFSDSDYGNYSDMYATDEEEEEEGEVYGEEGEDYDGEAEVGEEEDGEDYGEEGEDYDEEAEVGEDYDEEAEVGEDYDEEIALESTTN